MRPHEEAQLAAEWMRAAQDPAVAAELEAIYRYVADAIEARKPVCIASGRCCKFEEWGHRLYVTGLEAAYTVTRLDQSMPALNRQTLAAAREQGGCPFQVDKLCGVHGIKPLGCRIYFCDETAQEWQQELHERMLLHLRQLHQRHGIEYRYGEWRQMLGILIESAPAAEAES